MKKPFFSYEEQRKRLEARGLIIADDDLFILQNHSYYALINVYKHPFLDPASAQEKYTTGATLKALYALAQFDNLLRSIYLRHLLLLEQHIKSMIAYEFAQYLQKNYPSHSEQQPHSKQQHSYLSEALYKKIILDENFKKINHLMQKGNSAATREKIYTILHDNTKNMREVLPKFQKIITKNPYETKQIKHYKDKYKFVPLWVAINELSFGDMSKFYTILPTTVKRKIVKRLIDPAMKEKDFKISTLINILHVKCTHLRNFCAHNRRIYNETFGEKERIKPFLSILSDFETLAFHFVDLQISLDQLKEEQDRALQTLQAKLSPQHFNIIKSSMNAVETTPK